MRRAILPLALLLPFVVHCSPHPAAPAAPVSQAAPSPPANDHPNVTATGFRITPATVARGGRATVSADIANAPANLPVDVTWFREDGWSVASESATATGGKVTAPVPAEVTAKGGKYHAVLRAGLDDLATGELTVSE